MLSRPSGPLRGAAKRSGRSRRESSKSSAPSFSSRFPSSPFSPLVRPRFEGFHILENDEVSVHLQHAAAAKVVEHAVDALAGGSRHGGQILVRDGKMKHHRPVTHQDRKSTRL